MTQKVGIVTECVCDLPTNIIQQYDIGMVYFLVETDHGVFVDTKEITASNVLSYISEGGVKCLSSPPSPVAYKKAFDKALKKYDKVLLITISGDISDANDYSHRALQLMGEDANRVTIFDSRSLSTGMGLIVMRAAEMAALGQDMDEILGELETIRDCIPVSFMAENADYLYNKGFVSAFVKNVCRALKVHPIIKIKRGRMVLNGIGVGDYQKALLRQVKKTLRQIKSVDTRRVFITHTDCDADTVELVKEAVSEQFIFGETWVTNASATITSNCGHRTLGVLLIRTDKVKKHEKSGKINQTMVYL